LLIGAKTLNGKIGNNRKTGKNPGGMAKMRGEGVKSARREWRGAEGAGRMDRMSNRKKSVAVG
jgi:hypothetical protein